MEKVFAGIKVPLIESRTRILNEIVECVIRMF